MQPRTLGKPFINQLNGFFFRSRCICSPVPIAFFALTSPFFLGVFSEACCLEFSEVLSAVALRVHVLRGSPLKARILCQLQLELSFSQLRGMSFKKSVFLMTLRVSEGKGQGTNVVPVCRVRDMGLVSVERKSNLTMGCLQSAT